MVFGNYSSPARGDLRTLYANEGGVQGDLGFASHLSDEELRQLYRLALLTIVPSRAEGFSIPIVESFAAGTPVVVSNVDAHPELVADSSLRFFPEQPDELSRIIDEIAGDESIWKRAQASGAQVWPQYTEGAVAQRFFNALFEQVRVRPPAPAVQRRLRPGLAVLTPLPPAPSGIADYSAVTLTALSRFLDIHAFTDSPGALPIESFHSVSSIKALGLSSRRFDATLSIMGNSDHHTSIFHYLLDHGGAALVHDARLVNFYAVVLGLDKALEVGQSELKGDLSRETLNHWLHNQHDMPVLFLSEVAKAASPLLVHSTVTAEKIKDIYGVKPRTLPFAQYRRIDRALYHPDARNDLRDKLGWRHDELVVCSFGYIIPDKAIGVIVWAMRLLRDWGIKARLVLCGLMDDASRASIGSLVAQLDLEKSINFFSNNVSEEDYTYHLMAADIGVQLRTYLMGGLSGALNDCIAAALPTISNDHLARAMEAPSFVRRVPDALSPVLIAEAALDIIGSGQNRIRPIEEAREFARSHSPDVYARSMVEALGFDCGPA